MEAGPAPRQMRLPVTGCTVPVLVPRYMDLTAKTWLRCASTSIGTSTGIGAPDASRLPYFENHFGICRKE
jgi:hypothetical protein